MRKAVECAWGSPSVVKGSAEPPASLRSSVPVPGGIVMASEPNGSLIATRRCRTSPLPSQGVTAIMFRPVHDFRTLNRELVLGTKIAPAHPKGTR